MKIRANGIRIETTDTGAGDGVDGGTRPVVLLVMGLGMQLVAWPAAFIQALVAAGYRVVCFDNRDIGLSQHFDALGKPNLAWAMVKLRMGIAVVPPYSLQDMALDTLGVLDALGIERAHVVGVSMGGMVAQRVALAAPQRVISLASIMSSSGASGLPQPDTEVMMAMLGKPASRSKQAVVDYTVRLLELVGSPDFPTADAERRAQIAAAYERSYHPQGMLRQTMAIGCDTERAALLKRIQTPTLVLHGEADRLVPLACGVDTARRIPGARLHTIAGMGHDLPPGLLPLLLEQLLPHFSAASAAHPV